MKKSLDSNAPDAEIIFTKAPFTNSSYWTKILDNV